MTPTLDSRPAPREARDERDVWIVYGTRPEVVKLAPVARALEAREEPVRLRRIFTGQHDELARDLFPALGMEPDRNLRLMRPDQKPSELGARCLQAVDDLLDETGSPDLVLVQGDTSTVLFVALAAFFRRVPVGHVEAGLRTHRRYSPFPEEMIRRLAGDLAEIHFAPTPGAARNLREEGADPGDVHVTGNPAVDAVRWIAGLEAGGGIAAKAAASETAAAGGAVSGETAAWLGDDSPYVLVTLHRRESWGEPMARILGALGSFARDHPELRFFFPVHPNPRVRRQVRESGLGDRENVRLAEPVDYLDMVRLIQGCRAVFTDSGGLQEEAPSLGKRVVVAREETERPEGMDSGWLRLVGSDPAAIRDALEEEAAAPARSPSVPLAAPHGDGRTGERVADIVLHRLAGTERRIRDWSPGTEVGDTEVAGIPAIRGAARAAPRRP